MVLDKAEQWLQRIGARTLYIVLMLLFGTAMLLVTPPYQVPDEPMHVFRAWQVSEGVFISPVVKEATLMEWTFHDCFVTDIPESLWSDGQLFSLKDGYSWEKLCADWSMPLQREDTMQMVLPNTGAYAPLAYVPQAVAAFVGRWLALPVGAMLSLMRFAGLLWVIGCGWLALRLLPEKRLLIFALSFMPMFLFQSASASADATVFGVCWLGTAYLLSLRRSQQRLRRGELVFLLLLAVSLGLLKQVYGVLLLLYFFVPWQRLGSRRCFWGYGLLLLVVALLTSAAWLKLGVLAQGGRLAYMPGRDATAQLAFMKADIKNFVGVFCSSVIIHCREWYTSFIGQLAWLNVALPNWFLAVYGVFLLVAGISGRLGLRFWERLVMVAAFGVAAVACIVSQYLNWTPVGASGIDGVQGRYFIPVAMLLLVAFSSVRCLRYEYLLAVGMAVLSALVSLRALFGFFY